MLRQILIVFITFSILLTTSGKAMESSAHDCQSMSGNMDDTSIALQYKVMDENQSAHHGMSHGQTTDDHASPTETSDNCCEAECSCPSNMCSSVHYLASLGANTVLSVNSEKISIYSAGLLIQQPSALLRPPIIA